jgi:hypothetical protein
MSRVPVEKLRAEVTAAGLEPYELAAMLGWTDRRGWIDSERVERILGLRTYQAGHRAPQLRHGVNWATAQTIRDALAANAAAQTHPGQDTDATAATGEMEPHGRNA